MNHIHEIQKQKRQNELWALWLQFCTQESQVALSSPESSPRNSVKLPCVYHEQTVRVPWTPPKGSLLPAASDYFSLKPSLSVRGFHGHSIPSSCFPQKQRNSQHSRLFMFPYLKLVRHSCFQKSSLTREWHFVTSTLFTFSRKNFKNPDMF